MNQNKIWEIAGIGEKDNPLFQIMRQRISKTAHDEIDFIQLEQARNALAMLVLEIRGAMDRIEKDLEARNSSQGWS